MFSANGTSDNCCVQVHYTEGGWVVISSGNRAHVPIGKIQWRKSWGLQLYQMGH